MVSWFLDFKVSWFLRLLVSSFMRFLVSPFYCQLSISCFLEDIDPIFKIPRKIIRRIFIFVQVPHFSKNSKFFYFPNSEIPQFKHFKLPKLNNFKIPKFQTYNVLKVQVTKTKIQHFNLTTPTS